MHAAVPTDAVAHPPAWRHWATRAAALPPAYAALLILLAATAALRPQLLAPGLLWLMLRQAAPLGLAVVGQSLVMRCLSLDLSFAGVAAAVSYLLTGELATLPPGVLLGLCALLGLAVGVIQAFFIVGRKAPAVIVSLAMALVLGGAVLALTQQRAPGDAPEWLRAWGRLKLAGAPVPALLWLALLPPLGWWLRRSVLGRSIEALGDNPRAACIAGLAVQRCTVIAHLLCSLLAVAAAITLVAYVGAGSLQLGQDLALNALAAAILGGTGFGFSRGGLAGPAVAAFMLTFLFNFLTSLGLGEPGRLVLKGLLIALACGAQALRRPSAH